MSRIEDQANYYKNYHLRYRNIIAVIHVEDDDDKKFWSTQLQNIRSGEYHFVTQSKSEQGNVSKGCEQCLKYLPYLNNKFFICIDSDLRLLRGEEGLTPENHIAQTYAYSWENHSCEAKHLEYRFRKNVPDSEFSFVYFLKQLSEIVYKPLLHLVYHKSSKLNRLWNITKFNRCLPNQLRREDLEENGEQYLLKVKNLFDSELASLSLPVNFSIEGLTPDNAYLHIQGHKLYDLIVYIGTMLCKGKRIAFKSEVLDKGFPISGYTEIDSVQSDLRTILQE
ncbi:MAG: DUF4435 domain-containing protein [Muribaculaceae bacterium]|nr:DUF4435 domain-containing protein [Muribaculaceae bacterium]MDE6753567.1 DUF4435 domain-containing protein [Muribaculaceae bacterium]